MSGSARDGKTGDPPGTDQEADLSDRRDQLNQKIAGLRAAEEAEQAPRKGNPAGWAQALKLSSEFVAGVLVGAAIGWVGDYWLGTSPFGLIVFLLLGFAAGVLNVLRSAGHVEEPFNKPDRTDGPEN